MYKKILDKSGTDFDEFRVAEILVEQDIVRWPEISGDMKAHAYRKAIEKAKAFIKSDLGIQLISQLNNEPTQTRDTQPKMSCRNLF